MDLSTDIPIIKSEPVPYKEDGREVVHTEMAIEYSDNADDYLAGYYEYNQPTGVDVMRNADQLCSRVEPVYTGREGNYSTRNENGKSDKRERSINFTREECEKLVKIVSRYKYVVENKKSDNVWWKRKEATWKKIEAEFNTSSATFRSCKTLKIKYDGFKRAVRKKSALIRSGEVTSSVAPLDATEIIVMDMICLDAQNATNCADGDDASPDNPTSNTNCRLLTMEEEVLPTPCRLAAEDVPRFPSTSTVSASSMQNHSHNTAMMEEAPDKPATSEISSKADGMGSQQRNRRKIPQLLTPVHHTAPSRSGNLLDERRSLIRLQRKLLLEERSEKMKDFKEKELERKERALERRESRKERVFKEQEREKLNRILALKEEYLLYKLKILQANK